MRTGLRITVAVSLLGWLGFVLVWVLLLGIEYNSGCPPFQSEDSNTNASRSWKWSPPGNECTYDIDNKIHVDKPSEARLGMIVLLICWPVSTIVVALAGRDN